jgi:predicted dehydrogenase
MVKLAVVGLGYWGPNLLRNFAQLPEAEVLACCDLDRGALKQAQEKYPAIYTTTDYDSLLKDPELDAVVLATPAATHYRLVKLALLCGKHVFVEKPLTLDVKEALELVELSETMDKKLMVGHLMLYHPAIEKLKALVRSGVLGEVYYLYSQRVNLGKIRQDENALWSLAPHDISIACYLLGGQPESVSANGQSYLQEGVEDVAFLNLRFPNRLMAHIQLSWLDPHKIRRTTIVGSKKMAVFDDVETTEMLKIYDKGVDGANYSSYGEFLSLRFGDIYIPHIKMTEPLRLECQHFVDCIQNHRTPISDGRNGLQVVRVLQAAQRSLASGGGPVFIEDEGRRAK